MDRDEMLERLVKVEEAIKEIEEVRDTQKSIISKLDRYEGAWGMLLMVSAALFAGYKIFMDYFFTRG